MQHLSLLKPARDNLAGFQKVLADFKNFWRLAAKNFSYQCKTKGAV
jgi:hypothetical protein